MSGRNANPFLDEKSAQSPDEALGVVRSKILDVQHDSKASTQRSLALLHETDAIGTKTAENLIEQGEQLERTNRRMDEIDNNLKQSQRDVNRLKSIFGRFTNWKLDKKEKKDATGQPSKTSPMEDEAGRPVGGLKQLAGARPVTGPTSNSWETTSSSARRPPGHAGNAIENEIEDNERQLEADLGDMAIMTDRLKALALGMGDELDKHNQMIDKLSTRVAHTDKTVSSQEKTLRTKVLKN